MPETPERSRPGKKEFMAVTVRIPTQLRELSGGASEVTAAGGTVAAVLAELETTHPGFSERLFDEGGQLRRFVNVFVADEDIRFLDGVDTPVGEGQTVSIVPAVAGG
jgi:molybdopterin synthase sulfur carrier subunit